MKVYIVFCWMDPANVVSVWSTREAAEAVIRAGDYSEIMEVQEFTVDQAREDSASLIKARLIK